MFTEMIPKNKFWVTNYPNLDSSFEGLPIPEFYGEKDNIAPMCIDTTILEYKLANREIYSIEAIQADGVALTITDDYEQDLANAEFTVYGMPYLTQDTTYYIVVTGDWTVNGSDYVNVGGDSSGSYSDGQYYRIDGGGIWTGDSGVDLCFRVYGKTSIEAEEELMVEYTYSNYNTDYAVRDAGARTQIAQSFKTPATTSFFCTKVTMWLEKNGTPTGDLRVEIHSDQSGTRVGGKTVAQDVSAFGTSLATIENYYNEISEYSEILVSAKGYKSGANLMENVSEILEDVIVTVLGKDVSDLDATSFSALESARSEKICAYLNHEISFQTFLNRLEAGSLFKFQHNLDDAKYTVDYYITGEPAGTPHFRDEDFITFSSWRDRASIIKTVQVNFDDNPSTQMSRKREVDSEVAEYIYKSKEELVVETYLKEASVASTLATTYLDLCELPQMKIVFKVSGYGFDMRPTQKVKITKTRADASGGSLTATLFRILSIKKEISTGVAEITAILDSQSY